MGKKRWDDENERSLEGGIKELVNLVLRDVEKKHYLQPRGAYTPSHYFWVSRLAWPDL